MDEIDNIAAVVAEFMESDEEMQRKIQEEWERRSAAGETIREGEASLSLALDWYAEWGTRFEEIIRRHKD